MPFDIAAEVKVGVAGVDHRFQEDEGVLGEGGAFLFFLAVGHDADDGFLNRKNLVGVDRAHDGIGGQVFGLGLRIGPGIENITRPELVGDRGGDSGAVDALEKAKFDGGGGDGGTGVASGNHRLRQALFHEVGGDGNGTVAFSPNRFGAGLVHLHNLTGVHDAGLGVGEVVAGAAFLEQFLVTHENDFVNLRVEVQGVTGTDYINVGGIVPAHGIESDNHQVEIETATGDAVAVKIEYLSQQTSFRPRLRRELDVRDRCHRKGKRCDRGRDYRTRGTPSKEAHANGSHHGAFSASS